eukprot:6207803-Pleurochrysis_carterae.AAC.1
MLATAAAASSTVSVVSLSEGVAVSLVLALVVVSFMAVSSPSLSPWRSLVARSDSCMSAMRRVTARTARTSAAAQRSACA